MSIYEIAELASAIEKFEKAHKVRPITEYDRESAELAEIIKRMSEGWAVVFNGKLYKAELSGRISTAIDVPVVSHKISREYKSPRRRK